MSSIQFIKNWAECLNRHGELERLLDKYYKNPAAILQMVSDRKCFVAFNPQNKISGFFSFQILENKGQIYCYLGLLITAPGKNNIAPQLLNALKEHLFENFVAKVKGVIAYGTVSNYRAYQLVYQTFPSVYPNLEQPNFKPNFYDSVLKNADFLTSKAFHYKLTEAPSVAIYQKDFEDKVTNGNIRMQNQLGFDVDLANRERLLLMFKM